MLTESLSLNDDGKLHFNGLVDSSSISVLITYQELCNRNGKFLEIQVKSAMIRSVGSSLLFIFSNEACLHVVMQVFDIMILLDNTYCIVWLDHIEGSYLINNL